MGAFYFIGICFTNYTNKRSAHLIKKIAHPHDLFIDKGTCEDDQCCQFKNKYQTQEGVFAKNGDELLDNIVFYFAILWQPKLQLRCVKLCRRLIYASVVAFPVIQVTKLTALREDDLRQQML